MGWAGQTWAQITQEGTAGSSYGVYNSGGTVLYPTIYGPNAFTARRVPQRQVIRTADAGNRRRQVVARRYAVSGTFNTLLHPDQAAYWIAAATTLSTDGGGHYWLPSYSFAFFDSIRPWRFLGGMIQSLTITSTAQQDYVSMSMNWIFQSMDGTFSSFPQPAEVNYSTLVPYGHVETASNCTLGGTAFTKYRTITVNINNVLQPTWDELSTISAL